ncbi:MAG TPA: efflux RND transporter periplasmic adaptor subunit [Gallionellaceae bacterium]|nr:efflux RND transporter periplasmic adaptor subunit [Gallionellaceae bacterium]
MSIVLLLAACGGKDGQQPPGAPGGPGGAPPAMEVDVITIAPGSVVLTQDLPGRLEAYRTAQVRARVEGVVEKRLFTEGSDVKAGDKLFLIDERSYATANDAARADNDAAQRNLDRYKPLLAAHVVSQQAYDLVEARLKQTQAAYAKSRIDLENAHVPAPISGHIGRAQVTEGALVGRGEATLMATVEQIDPIYANFNEAGADVLRLQQAFKSGKLKRAGSDKVELVLEDGSTYGHAGKLLFSDLAVDPSTGSVSIRALFPNPRHELLPGMFARIRFPEASADNSIKVPQRAVQAGPQGQFVMVVDGEGKVTPRPVKTGGMAGADFVINEGLKVGEQVIVNGLQKARPGSVVKPVPWNPQAGVQPPEKK